LRHRWFVIFCLILAGEAIFSLPFHVARFFRATMLEVFGFSNADLGDVFAVYGITAMLAYFPGGTIADRFTPRTLLTVSMTGTAAGGLYMASVPGIAGMSLLFAYWGVTSILLFWAALIKSTREWGGVIAQGRAFGILDGGRGLLAAALASIAVTILNSLMTGTASMVDPDEQRAALVGVIYFYTAVTFAAGVFCWFVVAPASGSGTPRTEKPRSHVREVLRQPLVWIQALIVVCAYCGYKGLDNYSLYAVDVLGMTEVDAARFTANSAFLRPLAAVAAGFLADRIKPSRMILSLFVVLAVTQIYLGFADPAAAPYTIALLNILVSFAAVYALRGVYFALLEETRVPGPMTGTAVGFISLVGYTPDIFFAAIGGRLIDSAPGITGHQYYFLFLGVIMLVGIAATLALMRLARPVPAPAPQAFRSNS